MLVRLIPAEALHFDGLIPTVKLGLFCDDVWGNILPCIGTSRCLEGDDHIRQLSKHYCRSSSPCASDIPSERLLFQKDNVPVHTTNCVQARLQEHDDERCSALKRLLNGYVNKENCRIWSEAYLQVYVETPLHPEKLTFWCALWAAGIIGPYFFKNDEGHNVTVNGDRYRAMITNFFIPELNNHDVQELWFQQDGATCYTAHATIDLLKDTFGERLISRFVPVN
ncbi:uncharacterized protein TNCV_2726471 [Trichonephila clavipes]|nr:uncharacterized protein TNCV_2726471 [Trichonephila clavipes]